MLRPVANVGAKFTVWNVLQMTRVREPLAELHRRAGYHAPPSCNLAWRRATAATSFVSNARLGSLQGRSSRMIRFFQTAPQPNQCFSRRAPTLRSTLGVCSSNRAPSNACRRLGREATGLLLRVPEANPGNRAPGNARPKRPATSRINASEIPWAMIIGMNGLMSLPQPSQNEVTRLFHSIDA